MEETAHETTARVLERDIEHDRRDLDRTLTELQDRLSFDHLMTETGHYLAQSLESAAGVVRRHPLSAAAVLLLASGAIAGRSRVRSRRQAQMHAIGALGLHRLIDQMRRSAAWESIPESVASGGREVARQGGQLLHEAQRLAQHGGQRLQDRVETMAERQPGLLNALAMALGSAVVTVLSRR